PGQLPAGTRRTRRGRGRRVRPAPDPVRDGPSTPLLPAAHRPADGPAAPVGQTVGVPVQGHGVVLERGGERQAVRGPGVDVPLAAAGEPEDRGAGLLLQRAGGPARRRRRAAATTYTLRLRADTTKRPGVGGGVRGGSTRLRWSPRRACRRRARRRGRGRRGLARGRQGGRTGA